MIRDVFIPGVVRNVIAIRRISATKINHTVLECVIHLYLCCSQLFLFFAPWRMNCILQLRMIVRLALLFSLLQGDIRIGTGRGGIVSRGRVRWNFANAQAIIVCLGITRNCHSVLGSAVMVFVINEGHTFGSTLSTELGATLPFPQFRVNDAIGGTTKGLQGRNLTVMHREAFLIVTFRSQRSHERTII